MNKIIYFNSRSRKYNNTPPLSVLQIDGSIICKYKYVIVDGNFEIRV